MDNKQNKPSGIGQFLGFLFSVLVLTLFSVKLQGSFVNDVVLKGNIVFYVVLVCVIATLLYLIFYNFTKKSRK